MLLETLDVKQDDIILYSYNVFDLENNFKIIYKDDPDKSIRKISYGEVCRFVNEVVPKNLIVYRLLTNIKDFQINLSKYGFFININNATELIYFDPVYAVKELEDYAEHIDRRNLRFRIQQVGLTTLGRKRSIANYAEIYSIDLEATEARHQNDSAFVEALFAIDKSLKRAKEKTMPQPSPKKETVQESGEPVHKIKVSEDEIAKAEQFSAKGHDDVQFIDHDISEDKDFDYRQIMKINYRGKTFERRIEEKEEKKDTQETSLKEFIRSKTAAQAQESEEEEESVQLIDIFKSSESLKKMLKDREDKKVVLKLRKK